MAIGTASCEKITGGKFHCKKILGNTKTMLQEKHFKTDPSLDILTSDV